MIHVDTRWYKYEPPQTHRISLNRHIIVSKTLTWILITFRNIPVVSCGLLLIQDGVNGDGCLSCLSISNDELSLATANGDQAVHGLKASGPAAIDLVRHEFSQTTSCSIHIFMHLFIYIPVWCFDLQPQWMYWIYGPTNTKTYLVTRLIGNYTVFFYNFCTYAGKCKSGLGQQVDIHTLCVSIHIRFLQSYFVFQSMSWCCTQDVFNTFRHKKPKNTNHLEKEQKNN